jgi:hypothetical protein
VQIVCEVSLSISHKLLVTKPIANIGNFGVCVRGGGGGGGGRMFDVSLVELMLNIS